MLHKHIQLCDLCAWAHSASSLCAEAWLAQTASALNAVSVSDGKTLPVIDHLGMAVKLARAVKFTGIVMGSRAHRCTIR